MAEEQGKNVPKVKQSKSLERMWKEMQRAESSAESMGGMFSLLQILEPLLKPLEIILEIVGALFGAMTAEILPPLIEALQPLFDWLIDLIPAFQDIGRIIGQMVATYLPIFITLLMDFLLSLIPLIPTIMDLIGIIAELATKMLPIIITIFVAIADVVMAVLKPILSWLASLSVTELSRLVYVFGLGLSAIYGLMQGGPILAAIYAGIWAASMSPLLTMEEGGIATRPMVAEIGHGKGGEAVIPMTKLYTFFDGMERQQAETNEHLRAIYQDKVFRHKLSGGW